MFVEVDSVSRDAKDAANANHAIKAGLHCSCVDITDLLAFARARDTVSGIQRVVIQLISGLIELHGVENVDVIRFDEKRSEILRASAAFFKGYRGYDQAAFCHYFGLTEEPPKSNFEDLSAYLDDRYKNKKIKWIFNYWRLSAVNRFNDGRSFSKRNIVPTQPTAAPHGIEWRTAEFSPRDRILILGATWEFDSYASAIAQRKTADGFQVFQMVHDLIPLVTPEHVDDEAGAKMERYLENALRVADVVIANSVATAKDIERYAVAKGRRKPRTEVVRLAHEFVLGSPKPLRQQPLRLFNDRGCRLPEYATPRVLRAVADPYVLVVGTIESRKNLVRLIRVWRRIYADRPQRTPNLVLAGALSFQSQEILALLNSMGHADGKIVVLNGADDGEVAFLYANCLFSVCLSYYEGWGLPVGESMWFERPVLASATSSLPEVGGDLVDYCDPYDDHNIEEKLTCLMFDDAHRNKRSDAIAKANLRAWKDVVLDMSAMLEK